MDQGHDRWLLDCAHNALSLPVALEWFDCEAKQTGRPLTRVLIFGHESKRNTQDLISLIVKHCEDVGRMFDLGYTIFTQNQPRRKSSRSSRMLSLTFVANN